jgi:non-ribosomal peptide synthetase component F
MSHVMPDVPPEQRAIRATCVCPAGTVAEFTNDEVERSIPDRLETIVRNSPDRLAAKMGSHVVTYAELNAMANRVARSVLSQPGDNDEPVALLLDKGIGQIAAMLGVLKAGRCFVLLDSSFPTARLTATLEDSQAGLVLTDGENASRAKDAACRGSHLIELDSVDCDPSSGNLGLTISPNALAYITYTSGSTGRPKGVMQTHRTVLHDMMRRTRTTPLCVHDRLPLLTYGTSNAVKNTLFALLNGATLLPFDLRNEGAVRLADWLRRERITVLWISSPAFRNLCELLTDKDTFPDVRLLRLMSDAVYKTDGDLYKKHFPLDCVLVNGLHSSETGALPSVPTIVRHRPSLKLL